MTTADHIDLKKLRVLFLRSHGKICAYSFLANGLKHCSQIEFSQYPPFPSNVVSKLKKLPHRDTAWQDLQANLIENAQELSDKLDNGYFDLVLLADHNAQLTASQRMGWIEKLKTRVGRIRNYRRHSPAEYSYETLFPFSFSELCRKVPVCVVDFSDYPYLSAPDVDLLHHCAIYCKREVPYNRFVLYHQLFQFEYLSRAQKDEKLAALLDKIHNIPLGIPDDKFHALLQLRVQEQDIDLFWVGRISNTMRAKAEALFKEFAAKTSRKIVMPEERLSFQEYCQAIARSKITLSIEGGGWDCDRHYEAVALGSLPLMNKPTMDAVWWHEMPQEIFFENNFSNIALRIEQLLDNEILRQRCLQEAEDRVRKHMLWSKIVEYMVEKTLEKDFF